MGIAAVLRWLAFWRDDCSICGLPRRECKRKLRLFDLDWSNR